MKVQIEKKTEALKPYVGTTIYSLATLPASDGNFTSVINRATVDDLETALLIMTTYPENNAGRIKACARQLKKLKA